MAKTSLYCALVILSLAARLSGFHRTSIRNILSSWLCPFIATGLKNPAGLIKLLYARKIENIIALKCVANSSLRPISREWNWGLFQKAANQRQSCMVGDKVHRDATTVWASVWLWRGHLDKLQSKVQSLCVCVCLYNWIIYERTY